MSQQPCWFDLATSRIQCMKIMWANNVVNLDEVNNMEEKREKEKEHRIDRLIRLADEADVWVNIILSRETHDLGNLNCRGETSCKTFANRLDCY